MKIINNVSFKFLIFVLFCFGACVAGCAITSSDKLPDGFVVVSDIMPDVIQDIKYFGEDNFIGKRVDCYGEPVAILTKEAAESLKKANEDFKSHGYMIKIFDAYRPQSAVDCFINWAKDINDIKNKENFYPDVDKKDLFDLGYICSKSSHTRGSTVDMTIVDIENNKEIDTGSNFDFFGDISHHGTDKITEEQTENRNLIKSIMEKHGFDSYEYEWWHYTLKNEPYPDTYFDFPVKSYKNQ